MNLKHLLFVAGLIVPAMTQAAPTDKYFGYFSGDADSAAAANPGGPALPEIKDHINLYNIGFWSADTSPAGKVGTQNYVLGELEKARAAHIHATVPGYPFVFQAVKDANGNVSCWQYDSTAAASWSAFAKEMVDRGLLIPGDPAHSTVVAVYIADEPNATPCLSDVSSTQANPTFVNGINAIRNDPRTATLPIASILQGEGFDKLFVGMRMLDWVGFDHYGDDDGKWSRTLAALKQYAPGKKYIVVPGAMQNCKQQGVQLEPTDRYFNAIENDPDVTWIAPFAWFSGLNHDARCLGVRDIPSLRATYVAEGNKIKNLQCSSSLGEKWFCGRATDVSSAVNYLLNEDL